jgi:putative endonuclease
MTIDRAATGLYWETAASAYLERHGVETLLKRYRCRLGELDLVCADGNTLVIVEVRARRSDGLVSALASVDARKQRRIVRATRHLLMRHPAWCARPIRFDVVAIENIDRSEPDVLWIKAAFDAS